MVSRNKGNQVYMKFGNTTAQKQAGTRYGLRVMGRTGTEYYTNHVWNNYKAAGFRVSARIGPYSPYHNSAFDISLNKKAIVREV